MGPETKSPIKIVGVLEQQVVIRLANKRRILFCNDDELLANIVDMVPVAGEGTFVDNTLVAFDQTMDTNGVTVENP